MSNDPYRRLINSICHEELVLANGYRKIGIYYVTVIKDMLVAINIWRQPYTDCFRAEVWIDYLDRRPPPFVRYQPRKDELSVVNWVDGWSGEHAWKPRRPLKGMNFGFWRFSNGSKHLKPGEADTLVRRGLQACHQRLLSIGTRLGTSGTLLAAISERIQRKVTFDDSSGLFPASPIASWSDSVILSWNAVLRHRNMIGFYEAEFFYNCHIARKCTAPQLRRFVAFLLASYKEPQKCPDAQSVHGYEEFLHRAAKIGKTAFFEMPTVKESLVAANLWDRIA